MSECEICNRLQAEFAARTQESVAADHERQLARAAGPRQFSEADAKYRRSTERLEKARSAWLKHSNLHTATEQVLVHSYSHGGGITAFSSSCWDVPVPTRK